MKIITTANLGAAFRTPLGTPVVALDEHGAPVAIGAHVSADPAAAHQQIRTTYAAILGSSDKISRYADFISSGLDIVADQAPKAAGTAAAGGAALALAANGISLANAISKHEKREIVVASVKTGADALDFAEKCGLFGAHPLVHTAVLVAKFGATGIDAVIPKPDPKKARPA